MHSISPVLTEEHVENEKVIALDQPEYAPIIGLPIVYPDGTQGIAVRFKFSEEEKTAIANGGDLFVTELTFGARFTPISIEIR